MNIHHHSALDLLNRALRAGADRTGITSARWNIAGSCETPRTVSMVGKPSSGRIPADGLPIFVDLETRCRQCDACKRHRKALWAARAKAEMAWNPGRTWFVTLTVRPEIRARLLMEASVTARKRGVDLSKESGAIRFKYLAQAIAPEITRYLKRVRRGYAATDPDVKLRYIAVAEPHKDGFPHWHMLVHEYEGIIRQKRLTRWGLGFVKAKLVSNGSAAAGYVAKYLAKGLHTRIRASQHYGSPQNSRLGIASLVWRAIIHPPKRPKEGYRSHVQTLIEGLAPTGFRRSIGSRDRTDTTGRPVIPPRHGPKPCPGRNDCSFAVGNHCVRGRQCTAPEASAPGPGERAALARDFRRAFTEIWKAYRRKEGYTFPGDPDRPPRSCASASGDAVRGNAAAPSGPNGSPRRDGNHRV